MFCGFRSQRNCMYCIPTLPFSLSMWRSVNSLKRTIFAWRVGWVIRLYNWGQSELAVVRFHFLLPMPPYLWKCQGDCTVPSRLTSDKVSSWSAILTAICISVQYRTLKNLLKLAVVYSWTPQVWLSMHVWLQILGEIADNNFTPIGTCQIAIRHVVYELLIPSSTSSVRCTKCMSYRGS